MEWLPIFLIGLGILLLFIELILLPGFGAAGVPGLVLICIGVGMIWGRSGWETALMFAGGALVVMIPLATLGLWLAPRTRFGKAVILDTAARSADGFQAPPKELANLIGKSGRATSPLRPAGIALINDQRVDVVTRGEFIEDETEVEVIFVEGSRVVVRGL
jgi:membrane-bound serine protease (ClpP class)